MGDPLDPDNPLGHEAVLAADETGELLPEGERMLDDYGLNAEFVPQELGGRLVQADRLAQTLRAVFRRDCTLGLGYGVSTFIAATSVWTSGSPSQRRWTADLLLAGGKAAAGISDLTSGNDFARAELEARADGHDLLLNGGKQVINNLSRAEAGIFLARTGDGPGPRSHSHLLIDMASLPEGRRRYLPRQRTAGARGCRIAGIEFTDCLVPGGAVIGELGGAMDTASRAFQVTRGVLPGMALGGADTELRTALRFTLQDSLHGRSIAELPHSRAVLANAFLDLLVCDALSTVAARALHVLPAQASVFSAAAKYLVPKILQETGASLAVLLGARAYLREGPYGIFQKNLRDLPSATFGHANSAVCQRAIIPQLPRLARRSWLSAPPPPPSLFRLGTDLPPLDFGRLSDSARGMDNLSAELMAGQSELAGTNAGPMLRFLVKFLGDELLVLRNQCLELPPGESSAPADPRGFDFSDRYATLLAAAACLGVWRHNQHLNDPFLADTSWLTGALARLAMRLGQETGPVPPGLAERIYTELLARHEGSESFDLLRQQLATRKDVGVW